jgi:chromosome segregation ATPase
MKKFVNLVLTFRFKGNAMDNNVERFKELKEQIDKLKDSKTRIDERHKSERDKLEKLIKEITSKGYDPTKLSEVKTAKEAELEKTLSDLEAKVAEVSSKLSVIESL